jgi:hypothetical protein
MKRKMNSSPIFRKFALKLKRERLWNRFRILEYYFHTYTTESNNPIYKLYDALKHPDEYDLENKYNRYKIFGDKDYIPIEKIFEYYSV